MNQRDIDFLEKAVIEIYTHGEVSEEEAWKAALALWEARPELLMEDDEYGTEG